MGTAPPVRKGISPIDFTPKEVPVWVVMKKVPPILLNPEGVSWLSSQIGRPINKYVRDGLDVKVCIIKDVSEEMPNEIVVDIGDDEIAEIVIEVPQLRTYKDAGGEKIWVAKKIDPQLKVPAAGSAGSVPDTTTVSVTVEGVERSTIQQNQMVLSPKPVFVTDEGMLVSDEEVDEEIEAEKPVENVVDAEDKDKTVGNAVWRSDGEKVQLPNSTFVDFLSKSQMVSPKGIINRPKRRRR
ncbi:hypothetical protein LINPERPRIM_LOCUS11333 [Linum perenne]